MRRRAALGSLLSVFLLSSPPLPAAAGGFDTGADPASGRGAGGFAARLDQVSRRFLDVPYRLGPLGEEEPPDTDPSFRLDVFDCTTYVETVLAIALAEADAIAADREAAGSGEPAVDGAVVVDGDEARAAESATRRWLDRIRYFGAVPSFESRRHLVDSQWIPELVATGLLRDVTREIGGSSTRTGSIRLRRDAWERSSLARDLGLAWNAIPQGRHTIAYLPWHLLERDDVRAALPPVAVLSLVATPDPDVPTLITHQALLFHGAGGEVKVRHASSRTGRVAEEPLDRFVERSRALRRRTVLGVNVLAIVEPAAPSSPERPDR